MDGKPGIDRRGRFTGRRCRILNRQSSVAIYVGIFVAIEKPNKKEVLMKFF
jgi:hypothetical protein